MKNWLVATYKQKELKYLEFNLSNQKFEYYLPKVKTRKFNSIIQEKLLFPGYIFVNIDLKNYLNLKYTRGIKNVIQFGDNISLMCNEDIAEIKVVEELSKLDPITEGIKIGQEAIIKEGFLKGNFVKICSLPSNRRVDVFLNFLGSKRKITILEKTLKF